MLFLETFEPVVSSGVSGSVIANALWGLGALLAAGGAGFILGRFSKKRRNAKA